MKHKNLVYQRRGYNWICSDEGLTLEMSAFQSLYGGQFTLSTPSINHIFVYKTWTVRVQGHEDSPFSSPVKDFIIQHIDTLPKYGQKTFDVRRST